MMSWIDEAFAPPRARATGAVYLLYFLTAVLAESLVRRGLVVERNLVTVLSIACYIAVTLLFFGMFKPVNRWLSRLAVVFSLAGCAVMILELFRKPPLPVSPLLFFGPYCLILGALIFQSAFLPRALGVAMALAGLGWLAFLVPALAHPLILSIQVLGFCAEASLMLWLVTIGVNLPRWRDQAGQEERRHRSTRGIQLRRSREKRASSYAEFDEFAGWREWE